MTTVHPEPIGVPGILSNERFADPELDVLCVSCVWQGLSEAQLQEEPEAGNVLVYRAGVRGLPQEEYWP